MDARLPRIGLKFSSSHIRLRIAPGMPRRQAFAFVGARYGNPNLTPRSAARRYSSGIAASLDVIGVVADWGVEFVTMARHYLAPEAPKYLGECP